MMNVCKRFMSVFRNRDHFAKCLCVLLLSVAVAGCAGWVPGRKAYWDAQVKELCAKDGGVTVFESIELTRDEYRRLGGTSIGFPIPDKESSLARGFPYFKRSIWTTLNTANPEVTRVATEIVRHVDNRVLGRSVTYFRRGGDLPTGLGEASSFGCAETVDLAREVFRVRG